MSEFTGVGSWLDPTQNSDTGVDALDGDGAAATAWDVATYSPAASAYTILSGSEADNVITEQAQDGAEAAADAADPSNWLPWWAPYAGVGVGLLVLLVLLAPYAELGAEVAG